MAICPTNSWAPEAVSQRLRILSRPRPSVQAPPLPSSSLFLFQQTPPYPRPRPLLCSSSSHCRAWVCGCAQRGVLVGSRVRRRPAGQDGGVLRGAAGFGAAAAGAVAGRVEAWAAGGRGPARGCRGAGRCGPQPPHAVPRAVIGPERLLGDAAGVLQ